MGLVIRTLEAARDRLIEDNKFDLEELDRLKDKLSEKLAEIQSFDAAIDILSDQEHEESPSADLLKTQTEMEIDDASLPSNREFGEMDGTGPFETKDLPVQKQQLPTDDASAHAETDETEQAAEPKLRGADLRAKKLLEIVEHLGGAGKWVRISYDQIGDHLETNRNGVTQTIADCVDSQDIRKFRQLSGPEKGNHFTTNFAIDEPAPFQAAAPAPAPISAQKKKESHRLQHVANELSDHVRAISRKNSQTQFSLPLSKLSASLKYSVAALRTTISSWDAMEDTGVSVKTLANDAIFNIDENF